MTSSSQDQSTTDPGSAGGPWRDLMRAALSRRRAIPSLVQKLPNSATANVDAKKPNAQGS